MYKVLTSAGFIIAHVNKEIPVKLHVNYGVQQITYTGKTLTI